MAYIPSHLEVCPFWVNKTDNIETYCVVPVFVETNDYLYSNLDTGIALPASTLEGSDMFISSDGDIVFTFMAKDPLDSNQDATFVFKATPGTEPTPLTIFNSTEEIPYFYNHLDSAGDNIYIIPVTGTYNAFTSTFSDLNTTTDTGQDHATLIETLETGTSPYTFRAVIGNLNPSYLIFYGFISGTYYALKSIDGVNWTSHSTLLTLASIYEQASYMFTNQDSGNSGYVMAGLAAWNAISSTYKAVISYSADGETWVYKGNLVNPLAGDIYFEEAWASGMFYRDASNGDTRLILKYTKYSNDKAEVAIWSNYGATFEHVINPPILVDWSVAGYFKYHFTVDPATNTLFSLVTGGGTEHLFKSIDWGVNWLHVSELTPVEHDTLVFPLNSRFYPTVWNRNNHGMIIKNGWLIIGLATEVTGDITTDAYSVFQFKLADIV